jgi:catechol 2,3-dioxygenase-like lactoylglutathione lyase family enzyme
MRVYFWILLFTLSLGCATQEPVDEEGPLAKEAQQSSNEAGETYNPPPQMNFGSAIEYQSDDDIGLVARVHFATHTPDFESAWKFYQLLGYSTGRSGFPLTNTHVMARALGMFDLCQYELVRGAVIDIPGSVNTVNVDLLQFKTPFNDDPPYELPNHLGMAYAAMLTTNLDADYAFLKSKGVAFLSAPYGQPGERFAFFRDVDGVLYKLMEDTTQSKPAVADTNTKATTAHVIAMPYIGINVSDLDKSLDFYQRLGYTDVTPIPKRRSTLAEAQAYGLDAPFEYQGADVALARGDKHRLRLLQWIAPFNSEPPYPAPINHIGINRIAVVVADMERAVSILKSQGVEFLSEIAPCCSGTGEDAMAIVHALDPDGVFVELVGPITPRPAAPQPAHCGPFEVKMPTPEDIKDFTQGS